MSGYVAVYYLVGAVLVVVGTRGVVKNREDSAALFFIGVGGICLFWALIWTFGLHRQMGI